METDPETYDLVVVGSGVSGLTAACTAAALGRSVLLLEQAELVGGTSAISGGMVWIPINHKMAQAGVEDSLGKARTYLRRTVSPELDDRAETFLTQGDAAIRFLEAHTSVEFQAVMPYPDYYPQLPGSTPGGRVLEAKAFDGSRLGQNFRRLRPPLPEFMLFGGMMVSRADLPHFRRIGRSPRSFFRVAGLAAAYALQRLRHPRGTTLYLGNALIGRLFRSALDLGVTIRTGASVTSLVEQDGQIQGVNAIRNGRPSQTTARLGVILATGGISSDPQLRAQFVPSAAGTLTATVKRGTAASGARLAMALGAVCSPPEDGSAFWVPVSTFRRNDGEEALFPHTVTDRGKPGLIAVNAKGRRFVNEALSYHEFVLAQLRGGVDTIPAHLICDRDFLWSYGLGRSRPFALSLKRDIVSGYLKRGNSIAELAGTIGVPAAELERTVTRFNETASVGEDPEFGRGGDMYQRHLGDRDVKPNPCVRPILRPPFYSISVVPADLGMSAGLVTDSEGRVMRNGLPIRGLFACGNDMASIMRGAYPGPGITLGPAITFGYLAAKASCAEGIP